MRTGLRIVGMVAALLAVGAPQAWGTTLKDLQIGVRGIEFLTDPPRGQTSVAVIQDGRSRESVQDAQAILAWLATAVRGGKAELVPTLVDVQELAAAPPFRIAIVTGGVDGGFERIQSYARKNGTVTISADLDCVRTAACVLGARAEPSVEVVISRQASAANSVDFVRAFRMMAKEY